MCGLRKGGYIFSHLQSVISRFYHALFPISSILYPLPIVSTSSLINSFFNYAGRAVASGWADLWLLISGFCLLSSVIRRLNAVCSSCLTPCALSLAPLFYPIRRLLYMAFPASGAFARRMQFCPVLEYVTAVQASGRLNDKFGGWSHALLYMWKMQKDLLYGHMQFHG